MSSPSSRSDWCASMPGSSRVHGGSCRRRACSAWWRQSPQRPSRTPPRQRTRVPKPHRLHHPITIRNRRIRTQTPTPSIGMSQFGNHNYPLNQMAIYTSDPILLRIRASKSLKSEVARGSSNCVVTTRFEESPSLAIFTPILSMST